MTKIIPYILYFVTRLFEKTYTFEYTGLENLERARSESPEKNYILGLWHQSLFMIFLAHDDKPYTMIVSSSKDGDIIALACKLYGHRPVRGSSTRGGQKALTAMVEKLTADHIPGAITLDGPLGPAFKAKKGIVEIAYRSGTWILPCTSFPSKYWEFNSWDNFRLPKPFSKIIIHYGEPMEIGSEEEVRNYDRSCRQLEESLTLGEKQAADFLYKSP